MSFVRKMLGDKYEIKTLGSVKKKKKKKKKGKFCIWKFVYTAKQFVWR